MIEPRLKHRSRTFPAPPSPDQALSLLADIAAPPCDFSPVAADKPLALCGAGNLGRLARDFLRIVGTDFTVAIDRDASGRASDSGWAGVQLLHPDAVPDAIKREVRLAVSLVTGP